MALIHCNFFSETLGLSCSMDVILPQATSRQIGMAGRAGRGLHPALYLLHGLSDDHTIWQRRTSIERYVAELGLAVVMPAVDRSFYADMASGPRYWTFISEELPALARSFFPLSDRREDNFVAGLSMGGYGAMKLGLSCPDRFAAAASLSGVVDIGCRTLSSASSRDGFRWDSVFDDPSSLAGSENDLFELARRVASDGPSVPRLFLCCGDEDGLFEMNERFRDHLRELGLEPEWHADAGRAHDWGYWDERIQTVLNWLPLARADNLQEISHGQKT
ncbi:MAG: esterase family protein [Phycisphaeraceae bacterium]|nr:esterase family protein [Phycisphaeraceae bacterium]